MEGLQLGNRYEDDNRLLSTPHVYLTGSRDLKWAELSLELRDVVFKVDKGLSDACLRLIRSGRGRVSSAQDLVLNRHGSVSFLEDEGFDPISRIVMQSGQ